VPHGASRARPHSWTEIVTHRVQRC
jgi:hypothetical protein